MHSCIQLNVVVDQLVFVCKPLPSKQQMDAGSWFRYTEQIFNLALDIPHSIVRLQVKQCILCPVHLHEVHMEGLGSSCSSSHRCPHNRIHVGTAICPVRRGEDLAKLRHILCKCCSAPCRNLL